MSDERIRDLEAEVERLRRNWETEEQLSKAYRGYKYVIDEMIAVQRLHGIPAGGANLPDQFAGLLRALHGKDGWRDVMEEFRVEHQKREGMLPRKALREIVEHWDQTGADGLEVLIEYARNVLNQTAP